MKWWTFGGLKANASLAGILRRADGVIPRFDNYYVEIPDAGDCRALIVVCVTYHGTLPKAGQALAELPFE